MKYNATYKDAFGTEEIVIKNDGKTLSFTIGDIHFEGEGFNGFEITNINELKNEDVERFTFNQIQILNQDRFAYDLCNCAFEIIMPITFIRVENNEEFNVDTVVTYDLGKPAKNGGIEHEKIAIFLEIDGKNYQANGGWFEDVFDMLGKAFNNKYKFKNCYGCLFSDYSIYGSDAFGTLMCFLKQKEAYLQARTKSEHATLYNNFDCVQETHYCKHFQLRQNNTGYRG